MCTCLIAGRKATASGKVLLAANDDWDGVPGLLTHVNRQRHAPEDTRLLVSGRRIPQPPETCGYTYTACSYAIGTLDRGWAGGVNDRHVAAAGTGASAFKEIDYGDAWLEPDDILLLILERAESARDGIRMIGELVEQYGFATSGLDGCHSAATYAVADPEEGWFLEMAPGAHWLAVRVPDEEAGMRPNSFGIHDADLTDAENVIASPGLAEFARAQGWWDGDIHHFDFAAAYGADESPNEWGPELDPMNMRRRWRAMNLLSGKETPEDALLYSIQPDHPLKPEDFMSILRDVYEETPYDLRKVPAAGRYGNPFHDDPESYSLSRHATVASFVADFSMPGPGVMWTAMACPAMSCYIPLYGDISALPEACGGTEPDGPSLFWEWKTLGYLVQRRYSRYAEIVRPATRDYERRMSALLREEADALDKLPEEARRERCTALTGTRIGDARKLCRELRTKLETSY